MPLLWSLLATAVRRARQVAIVDDRRSLTYGKLIGGSLFVADAIESRTSARHVGLLLPTSSAFPVALWATWLAGRTAVPLNYLLSRDELAYVIRDSDIDTILTVGPMLEFLGGPQNLPPEVQLVKLEDLDFSGIPPLRWPPINRRDDLAVLVYTSGTSGKPKGVMLTHGNLHANVAAGIRHAGVTDRDVLLGVLPQFHSYGMTALTLMPLYIGAKVVYTARFVPKKIVELMREHRPTVFMGVPSMYGAILSVKEATAEDFTSLRFAVSGAEPLPFAVYDEWLRRFNVRLMEGYGLTETSPVTHWSLPANSKLHSVGQPLPGVTAVVVDESGLVLPPGRDGEILINGPNVMKGYYKHPETTAAVMTDLDPLLPEDSPLRGKGRWFRTGDIGRIDAEGFLFITGRKKEMFKVAGEMVAPRDIEEVLNQHPSVRDAAVIPKSDGMRGLVPLAFVELHDNQPFDENALRAWCRERLAGFKVPREIRRIDQLPRSPTGKILKRHLSADQA